MTIRASTRNGLSTVSTKMEYKRITQYRLPHFNHANPGSHFIPIASTNKAIQNVGTDKNPCLSEEWSVARSNENEIQTTQTVSASPL